MSNLKKIEYADIFDKSIKYLQSDGEPGYKLGFSTLDQFYTHKQGGVTDWTGFPGSGKTYFCLECLFNLSERYEKRHALYVPDIGSDAEIMAKLVKMKSGRDFSSKYGNKITEKELAQHIDWILHHFIIFKKKDYKVGVPPVEFWEDVCNYRDDGGRLDTGLIDSWKNLKHVYNGREDTYLDEMLSIRNELSEDYKVHFHTIAHAVKTEADKSGQRRVPTAWDIKGGGSWYANGKNILTVDFPIKTGNRVDLYISKVKPEDVGVLGSVVEKIFLDRKRGRYYEKFGFNKQGFAFEHEKYAPPEQAELILVPPSDLPPDDEDLPF